MTTRDFCKVGFPRDDNGRCEGRGEDMLGSTLRSKGCAPARIISDFSRGARVDDIVTESVGARRK